TYLKNVLQLTGGNISRAAQFAGRYRADFYKMLKKYGLHPSTTKGKPEPELEDIEEENHLTEGERETTTTLFRLIARARRYCRRIHPNKDLNTKRKQEEDVYSIAHPGGRGWRVRATGCCAR